MDNININEGMFDIEQFDSQVIQSILNLNNSEEFVNAGISLSVHEVYRPTKFSLKDIVGQRREYISKIKNLYFFNITHTTTLRVREVSFKNLLTIHKRPDGQYGYSTTYPTVAHVLGLFSKTLLDHFSRSLPIRLSENIKSLLLSDYNGTLRRQISIEEDIRKKAELKVAKAAAAEKAKAEDRLRSAELTRKQNAFMEKYNDQMILDQFSNVFDLCKGHEIGNKIGLNTELIKIVLFMDGIVGSGDGNDKRVFIKMTESTNTILSELMSTSERLLDIGVTMTYTPFYVNGRGGISVRLWIPNEFVSKSGKKKQVYR